MPEKLIGHREIWKKKKILRVIYTRWYRKISQDLAKKIQPIIELGAGGGNFKEFEPGVIASDIEFCQWLDTCFDAHKIPFKRNSVGNIVMIDVLHHLADPVGFFHEAERVLVNGGRIILIEPFPTLFSLFIYRRFHPEPFVMETDYFRKNSKEFAENNENREFNQMKKSQKKDPWEANQAIAFLLFFKNKKRFLEIFKQNFKVVKRKRTSYILYPASGGFENKAMIPDALIPIFKFIEIMLKPFHWLLAFRCYIVLEKIN